MIVAMNGINADYRVIIIRRIIGRMYPAFSLFNFIATFWKWSQVKPTLFKNRSKEQAKFKEDDQRVWGSYC